MCPLCGVAGRTSPKKARGMSNLIPHHRSRFLCWLFPHPAERTRDGRLQVRTPVAMERPATRRFDDNQELS